MSKTATGVDIGRSTARALRGRFKNNTFEVDGLVVAGVDGGNLEGAELVAKGWDALTEELPFKPGRARVGLSGKETVPVGSLTYIDQKRLELARALASSPKLLLLDEWLAGLNPTELQEGIDLIRSLREEGITIILVEHVMDAIRSLCDRCIVMAAGAKIAEGSPGEVLADPEVVKVYIGEDI